MRNTVLYEAVTATGFPAGTFGAGVHAVLLPGNRTEAWRIEGYIPRLLSVGAIRVAADQSAGEAFGFEPSPAPALPATLLGTSDAEDVTVTVNPAFASEDSSPMDPLEDKPPATMLEAADEATLRDVAEKPKRGRPAQKAN